MNNLAIDMERFAQQEDARRRHEQAEAEAVRGLLAACLGQISLDTLLRYTVATPWNRVEEATPWHDIKNLWGRFDVRVLFMNVRTVNTLCANLNTHDLYERMLIHLGCARDRTDLLRHVLDADFGMQLVVLDSLVPRTSQQRLLIPDTMVYGTDSQYSGLVQVFV
jgi:hypothetical protein